MLVKFIIYTVIEQFSIERRKTKTKLLTHSDKSQIIPTDIPVNQSKLQASTCGRRKSAGKGGKTRAKRIAIGFGFSPDWISN